MPDRIAVIGISASGKSTFARKLGEKLGLPVRHGDELDWLPNWGERPKDDLNTMHARWIAEPRWIIEGWIDPKRVARLDVLKENDSTTQNDDERFDSDMVLMTAELAKMIADLVEALGGEMRETASAPLANAA